ncbi:unnamed protein product [Moneuplotes crassus]|uniref:Uncharacterized protein n=1 Tax=Euplotes crassus TaxID=5936 RepID=A0AAD1UEW7_EUPCR|nr:unnamed protein product [Moneuplotes crassus]
MALKRVHITLVYLAVIFLALTGCKELTSLREDTKSGRMIQNRLMSSAKIKHSLDTQALNSNNESDYAQILLRYHNDNARKPPKRDETKHAYFSIALKTVIIFLAIFSLCGIILVVSYFCTKPDIPGKEPLNKQPPKSVTNHISKIDEIFESNLDHEEIPIKKKITQILQDQVKDNTNGQRKLSNFGTEKLYYIKKQTLYANTNVIYNLLHPDASIMSEGVTDTSVTAEVNPYQNLHKTFYAALQSQQRFVSEIGEFSFSVREVISDLQAILFNTDTYESLDQLRESAVQAAGSEDLSKTYEIFYLQSWLYQETFRDMINRAILFDSIKPSLYQETPEFYSKIYPEKSKNHYRTVLRCSARYCQALNWYISQRSNLNTESYNAYLYVSHWPLKYARNGDRLRFVNYQIVYIDKDNADPRMICNQLMPRSSGHGTIIKIIIPEECENCAQDTYDLHEGKIYKAIIPPYSVFTYISKKSFSFDGVKSKDVFQVNVELDVKAPVFQNTDPTIYENSLQTLFNEEESGNPFGRYQPPLQMENRSKTMVVQSF